MVIIIDLGRFDDWPPKPWRRKYWIFLQQPDLGTVQSVQHGWFQSQPRDGRGTFLNVQPRIRKVIRPRIRLISITAEA